MKMNKNEREKVQRRLLQQYAVIWVELRHLPSLYQWNIFTPKCKTSECFKKEYLIVDNSIFRHFYFRHFNFRQFNFRHFKTDRDLNGGETKGDIFKQIAN